MQIIDAGISERMFSTGEIKYDIPLYKRREMVLGDVRI